jgi:O-antigen ligase
MDATALVLRRGQYALNVGLAFGIALVLLVAGLSPTGLLLLPLILSVSVAAVFVVRRPLVNLFLLLFGIAFTSGYTEGITAVELLHGSYLLVYLVAWFADRLVTRKQIVSNSPERMFLLFLIVLPFTVFITILLQGSLREYAQEMFALMHLALYFPIRDACRRSERGNVAVVTAFLLLAAYAAVRNGFLYRENLLEATMGWQVEKNRIAVNDGILMTSSLFFTALVGMGPTRLIRLAGALGGITTLIGLVLTQSRAFWVCFLVGVAMILFILQGTERRRIVLLITVTGVLTLAVGLFILRSDFLLILLGLTERFTSIGTAATQDISLINRFRESKVVLGLIADNPVVGHGAGVGYLFFEIGRSGTDTDSLVHNAFLGLWYKWGIWGLFAIVYMWGSTIAVGLRTLRERLTPFRRLAMVGALSSLCVYVISANTANPFLLNDSLFLFALLFALVRGNTAALKEQGGPQQDRR